MKLISDVVFLSINGLHLSSGSGGGRTVNLLKIRNNERLRQVITAEGFVFLRSIGNLKLRFR